MRNIELTSKRTGKVTNVKLPECIANPIIEGGLACGATMTFAFIIGLVEDGFHLVKKLFKK